MGAALEKVQKEADKQAIQEEVTRTIIALKLMDEQDEISTLLFEATLLVAGYWRGRDNQNWRKRRGHK